MKSYYCSRVPNYYYFLSCNSITFILWSMKNLLSVWVLFYVCSMKHDMKNSKNPRFIEFVPVAVTEHKGEIRKGNKGNLTISSWTLTNAFLTDPVFKIRFTTVTVKHHGERQSYTRVQVNAITFEDINVQKIIIKETHTGSYTQKYTSTYWLCNKILKITIKHDIKQENCSFIHLSLFVFFFFFM